MPYNLGCILWCQGKRFHIGGKKGEPVSAASDIIWEPAGGARCATLAIHPDLTFLSEARSFTESVARAAQLSEERVFDLKVAVSEACANAVEHQDKPEGEVALCAWLRNDSVTVEVSSPGTFILRTGEQLQGREHRGMGLPLMIALSDEVQVRREPSGGNTVALTMYLSGRGPRSAGVPQGPGERVARERRRAEALAAEAHQRANELDATFDALDEPVLIFDDHSNVTRANRAALTQIGFEPVGLTRDEVRGRLRLRWTDGRPVPLTELPSWRAAHGEVLRGVHLLLASGEGPDLRIVVSATPLHLRGGRRGAVVAWRDVTKEERLAAERREGMRLAMALNDISRRISTTLDREEILSCIVRQAAQALGTTNATIVQRQGDRWVLTHAFGPAGPPLGWSAGLRDAPLAALAAETREVIAIEDAHLDGRADAELLRKAGAQAALVAPIVLQGSVQAFISFLHPQPRRFSPIERDFGEKLAAALAAALENAHLYLTQRRVASTVQRALLTVPDDIPGIRFGHLHFSATAEASIGGDFYDLFVLPHGRIGLVMGDVSGKGVEGAATAALVKNVLKAYAYRLTSTDEIMSRANELLLLNAPSQGFTTALLAIFDLASGTLTYSNAGHPPPMLRSAAGQVRVFPSGSAVLGALPHAVYRTEETRLLPGEYLLLYTDGVTEARRPQPSSPAQFFGEHRLAELFGRLSGQPEELPQLVYQEIEAFAGGQLHDDLALVCLQPTATADHGEER